MSLFLLKFSSRRQALTDYHKLHSGCLDKRVHSLIVTPPPLLIAVTPLAMLMSTLIALATAAPRFVLPEDHSISATEDDDPIAE